MTDTARDRTRDRTRIRAAKDNPPAQATPRGCIIGYLSILDHFKDQIDLNYGQLADALIKRLRDAGFVIAPRTQVDP